MERRSDIQGLRALAVAAVAAAHAGTRAHGGFVGVDVFFVISGYVIAASLHRELLATGRVRLGRFYVRRVRRLIPALAVMVVVVALLGLLLTPADSTRTAGLTGIFASLFAANIYLAHLPSGYFGVSAQLDPLLHTWTLAVEEQFYLLFPAVLFAAWMLFGRLRSAAALVSISCLGVGSFLIATHGHPLTVAAGGTRSPFAYYSAPARAWEFAVGAALALIPFRLPRLVAATVSAGAFGMLVLVIGSAYADSSLLTAAVIPVAATAALVAAGRTDNIVSAALSARPFVWLGDLSYSLYLWHWPLIVFAKAYLPGSGWAAPTAAVAALAPAYLSYRFIEQPMRSNRAMQPGTALKLASLGLAAAIGASTLQIKWPLVTPNAYAAQLHLDVVQGCDSQAPLGSPTRPHCEWGGGSRGTVALVGDSNAGQYAEPVIAAGEREGFSVEVATASGCPFVPLNIERPAEPHYAHCATFLSGTMNTLLRQAPSLVIIGSRADLWIDSNYPFGTPNERTAVRGKAARIEMWAHALRFDLKRLNSHGIATDLVEPLPIMPTDVGSCASVLLLEGRCRGTISRIQANAELADAKTAERIATRGLPLTRLVDLTDAICDPQTCSSERNGIQMFRDSAHLSVAGSLTLTNRFITLIKALRQTE